MEKEKKLSELKLLRYIGEITIVFCQMEDALGEAIADELNDRSHDMGYLVTCRMNFQQKLELYERLMGHSLFVLAEKSKLENFEKFVSEIRQIQLFRNHIMHGIRFNEKGELFLKKNYQKKMRDYDEGIDEMELPYKGWNAQYPKFQKFFLNERTLKEYLKRIEKIIDKFEEWYC